MQHLLPFLIALLIAQASQHQCGSSRWKLVSQLLLAHRITITATLLTLKYIFGHLSETIHKSLLQVKISNHDVYFENPECEWEAY